MIAPTTSTDPMVLESIVDHILSAEDVILAASEEHRQFRLVAEDASEAPIRRGRAMAYKQLAANRWEQALGARAALEALYQQLTGGEPSPPHKATTRTLEQLGVRPNPVGLPGPVEGEL